MPSQRQIQGQLCHDCELAGRSSRHHAAPRVFSFDLKGYGTLQFPQERVYCLAGWSDRVFDIMQKLDRDPEALVREVESVEICGADF